MGEKDLVSILIPVYNRETLVTKTIKSAINQTYQNIEIIIIDNCSTDNTWELLQNYALIDKRIKIFRNEKNLGPVRNWECCINKAKGKYSKILFSDDLIKDTFIEKTLSIFEDDVAYVATNYEIFNNSGLIFKSKLHEIDQFSCKKYQEAALFYSCYETPISPAIAIFRTEDLKKSLLIDIPNSLNLNFPRFGAGNDVLIFLISSLYYKRIRVVPSVECIALAHNDSLTISNNLQKYYDYSKVYFVNKYLPKYKNQLKSVVWLKNVIKRSEISHKLIDGQLNILFLFKVLAKYISKALS